MSLEEEPVIVSVIAIEETSFVIDVVTPPIVPAIDVMVIDPAAAVAVDIAGSPVDVTGVEVTSFVIDVVAPPGLSAIDVTVGDPAATIIVDIPGGGGDGSGLPTTGGTMTGAIQLPPEGAGFGADNTAIHFGDPDTGIYGSGGVPTFSVNGIQVLILNEDLVITPSIRQLSDGSASNPAYAFDSGIAGMYKSGDELAFASGGGVILPADPTADLHAATKQYVDARTPLITVAPSAPSSPATGDVWIDTEGVGGGGASGDGASPETAARVMASGLVIPYYLYPNNPYTDANVQLLLDLMRTYHDVPVLVVVNPADGPGTVMDGNWSAFIRMVQAAGGKVCGYVSTVYAGRAEADVKADIDLWLSVYSTSRIDGIFLDEQTWETGPGNVGSDYVDLYKRYTDYCHAAGLSPVIANPGTNQQGAYFATWTADIILVHEQTTWPSEATMEGNFVGGHADYSYTRRGALVYNQSTLDAGELATLRKNVQWVYVTDDNLTAGILNPWDSLPTYLDALFAALSE